jgi:hypothetical protein
MHYKVRHITTVDYAGAVRLARFNLRLKPAPWPGQVLEDFRLSIDPVPWSMQEEALRRQSQPLRDRGTAHASYDREHVRDGSVRTFADRGHVCASRWRERRAGPSVEQVRDRALRHRDLGPMGPANYLTLADGTQFVGHRGLGVAVLPCRAGRAFSRAR